MRYPNLVIIILLMVWHLTIQDHQQAQSWYVSPQCTRHSIIMDQLASFKMADGRDLSKSRGTSSVNAKLTQRARRIKSQQNKASYDLVGSYDDVIWWKHFPRYGPLCGNSTATGEFPTQRPVTRSFDVFFDPRLNKRLNKQSWGWWFGMPSHPLWRHCNAWWGLS